MSKKTQIPDIGRFPFLLPFKKQVESICAKHGVGQLYVFGSLASGQFDEAKSDVDFYVKFKRKDQLGAAMLEMVLELEKLFGRPVDLVRERPFANEYFAEALNKSKVLVYEA